MNKKAYELDQVNELIAAIHEKTDDIAKRLEVIYELGTALEERDIDELGEILEAVSDVVDDFHYSLSSYMHGTGIEYEKEEEIARPESEEFPGIEKFIEEKFEWGDEEDEAAPEALEEELSESEKIRQELNRQIRGYTLEELREILPEAF
jgi:hypothetical protein